jgi:hypothetical protein
MMLNIGRRLAVHRSALSAGPKRTLPKARFLPRSMALIVQKRTHNFF